LDVLDVLDVLVYAVYPTFCKHFFRHYIPEMFLTFQGPKSARKALATLYLELVAKEVLGTTSLLWRTGFPSSMPGAATGG